jgi:hypothetical protein
VGRHFQHFCGGEHALCVMPFTQRNRPGIKFSHAERGTPGREVTRDVIASTLYRPDAIERDFHLLLEDS